MSNLNKHKIDEKEIEQYNSIKKLLKDKKLNPKIPNDLKYLLSLTLRPKLKKFHSEYLLNFLLKYLNSSNESIFYEYFFHSCELGKINNVKILLEKGLSVNCKNDLGETPLHIAIGKNDIELIKLLIKYEPNTSLSTDKDSLTAMNYAEKLGNKTIIKMINELNEINKKKLIKSEIIDYINKDMSNIKNMDSEDMSSFINKDNNFDEIQNYNGEKMSIIVNEDQSNNIINNSVNKSDNIMPKNKDKNTITQTLFDELDLCEGVSPKNTIKVNNYCNNIKSIKTNGIPRDDFLQKHFTQDCVSDIKVSKYFSTELKYFTSPLKKKDELLNYYNNRSINPSCVQSLTTSHTINKEQFESPLNFNRAKSLDKKNEFNKFMFEIGLPKKYANYLLDNGFDDLEVLISQTKNGIALSEQNLKDVGIKLPGDRAKILIHLEELAGNFPFILERNVIYSNKIEANGSLYKFLTSINLEDYIKSFNDNGYYNAELLYTQMFSKHPINEDILKNNFGINKIGYIKRIMLNLTSCSENYIKKLKNKKVELKKYKSIVFERNPYLKVCEECLIF